MSIFVILSLLLGLPYAYTQITINEIENKYPPLGNFKKIDSLNIHYTDIGAGPLIVLLHSQPANERQFYLLKEQLKKNYRVISIDRPGMGYSDGPKEKTEIRLSLQAKIISKLIKEITQEKPLVVGHSYGGALALAYALNNEDDIKGLILVNTASHAWPSDKVWLPFKIISSPLIGNIFSNTYAMIYGKSTIEKSADDNFPNNLPSKNYIENVAGELTLRPQTLRSYAFDAINLRNALKEQSKKYQKIKLPITIIAGTNDRVTPNKIHSFQLHQEIKHSSLIKVDGVEHSIPELKPGVIEEEIRKILSE